MTIKQIKETCDIFFGFDISKKSNEQDYCDARYIYYYLTYTYADENVGYKIIGQSIGRTHGSIIHGINKYYDLKETDNMFSNKANELENIIKSKTSSKNLEFVELNISLEKMYFLRKLRRFKYRGDSLKKQNNELKLRIIRLKQKLKEHENNLEN